MENIIWILVAGILVIVYNQNQQIREIRDRFEELHEKLTEMSKRLNIE